MTDPRISVVVPSHDRPIRLLWLLNALEEQTLPREQWEVIVGHDSAGPETERLLTEHPLAAGGTLRHVTLPAGSAPPGANRNAALSVARAPLVAFTDDDCRPPADWLENAVLAAERHPGAIVQGRTIFDPDEEAILSAPAYHAQLINPPTPWFECCNIIYPRELIDRAGGFREDTYTGEDTDLALRVLAGGATSVAAPEVLTYHAVVETSVLRQVRSAWRWKDLPLLVKRHPSVRERMPMWIFWKRTHALLPVFAAGLYLGQRRNVAWTALCVPWLVHAMPTRGSDPRGRLRNVAETPGVLAVTLAEMAALAVGSWRYGELLI